MENPRDSTQTVLCSSRVVCDLGATDIPYETVDEWRWDFVAR